MFEGQSCSHGRAFTKSHANFIPVNSQGKVSLRSLHQQPYDPKKEHLEQATQSAPLLVLGGKRTQFNANTSQTRRRIMVMDKQGRPLVIVSPGQVFSRDQLADQLASSDLSIMWRLTWMAVHPLALMLMLAAHM